MFIDRVNKKSLVSDEIIVYNRKLNKIIRYETKNKNNTERLNLNSTSLVQKKLSLTIKKQIKL